MAPIRIGLLGCGVVGTEVVRQLAEPGRRPRPAGRRARWSWSASPSAAPSGSRRRPPSWACPSRCSPPTPPSWSPASVDVVVEVIGGIEPARTLMLSAMKHGASVVSANKALLAEDGATLHAAAESRRRPLLRGVGRRCHPAAAPAARVAGRRPGQPGARHRQRHHQLHPVPDGRDRRRLSRGAGGGDRARLRRGRSDRRRRGLRRRGQGRDPGRPRVPHPGHRGGRPPRGHHRGQLPPTSPAPRRWAASSSCSRSASSQRRRLQPSACASTRR